ncbi:hypothetical protein ACFLZF_00140, partial [Nanoarchaeota archaeon]
KKFNLGESIELEIKEKAICLDEGIEIEIKWILEETLAPCPKDKKSYPAGFLVKVNLIIKKDENENEISLVEASRGYKSKMQDNWDKYIINLIYADRNKAKLKINLRS